MKTLIPVSSKSTRVSISEDGTYAVGPTLDSISSWLNLGVAPETALNMITVYQCVRVLSNTFAQLPLILYRRLENGGKERATDHPLYQTLHLQPNPDLSSFSWRRLMMVHLATWGNHYAEKVPNVFGDLSLYPIRPDRIQVSREDGRRVYDYLDPRGGIKRMKDGSVFHVQGLSTDGLVGRSPISDLRRTIGLARSAESFGESFYRNGARPATVLKHPKTLTPDAITRLAGQMEALRGSGNAGKTVVLEEGLDFSEIGVPPEDAQFMETRLFQKREIAGAYGIPAHKINDLERATFTNIEHQSLELIQDTMMGYFVNTEQEIAIQLTPGEPDIFAEFLVDGYLRGDAKTRNEAYAIRWQHGTMNADEWRAKENENPIPDGGGEAYYTPVNYAPVSSPVPDAADAADAAASDMPQLVAVKSAAFRCPECNAKLAENTVPGMQVRCGRCKVIREPVADLKSAEPARIREFQRDAEGRLLRVVESVA